MNYSGLPSPDRLRSDSSLFQEWTKPLTLDQRGLWQGRVSITVSFKDLGGIRLRVIYLQHSLIPAMILPCQATLVILLETLSSLMLAMFYFLRYSCSCDVSIGDEKGVVSTIYRYTSSFCNWCDRNVAGTLPYHSWISWNCIFILF